MSYLYISEHGATIGIEGGNMVIKNKQGVEEKIPKNLIKGISMLGKSSLSPMCIQYCLDNNIMIGFYSQNGNYYGCLSGIKNKGIIRVKKQIQAFDNKEFSMDISRRIVNAKINNQYVVVKRYLHENKNVFDKELFAMRNARRKVIDTNSKYGIKGYEGISSKNYFSIISQIIRDDFCFDKRNRRPSRDPFNSMINFGYSVLCNEIYGCLESRGLNPYCGFLHEDRDNHPSLVSDMIEEWRAPIVDATVLSLVQGNEITINQFDYLEDGSCRMNKEAITIFLSKMEHKMYTEMNYLSYLSKPVSFRRALWHQAEKLAKAIDNNNPNVYIPVYLR